MKKLLAGLSLVLVLGLAVGGTLALFSATTNEPLTNTFTVGKGITLDIKEPTWDGKGFDGDIEGATNLGIEAAKSFAPGEKIAKDPTLKNTSDEVSVFAAMTIDYSLIVDGKEVSSSYNELKVFADIDFDETNWEVSPDKTVAWYQGAVAPGDPTEPLFKNVTIKKEADSTTMKNFNIVVKGYAVQEDGEATPANIKAVLNKQFGTDLVK